MTHTMRVLALVPSFIGTILVLAHLGYGHHRYPCPGFPRFEVFEDMCYYFHDDEMTASDAKSKCRYGMGKGIQIAEPRHGSEINFLNEWLLDQQVASVWLGATTIDQEATILEPSRDPLASLLRRGSTSERHRLVCQTDAEFEQRSYIFPSIKEVSTNLDDDMYLEVTSSFRNQVVSITLRYYQQKIPVWDKSLTLSYDRTVLITIETEYHADVCQLETDAPVTAMLYRVHQQAITGSLILPFHHESMTLTEQWLLYFITRFPGAYTFFIIGVTQQRTAVGLTYMLGQDVQKRDIKLEKFEMFTKLENLSGRSRVVMESNHVFNAFFTLDENCCNIRTVPHVEQVQPSALAFKDNVFLPVPVNDSSWKCSLDLYAQSTDTYTMIYIKMKHVTVPVSLEPDNMRFYSMAYKNNREFKNVGSRRRFQLKHYFKNEQGHSCRMDVLPMKLWTTRYAFNWRLIYTKLSSSPDEVFLYIVRQPTSNNVGILLNDDDVTDLFDCKLSTADSLQGCIGSLKGLTISEANESTFHLSTNLTHHRFGAYLLLQTPYQLMCRSLGFLDEVPNWIEASLVPNTNTPEPLNLPSQHTEPSTSAPSVVVMSTEMLVESVPSDHEEIKTESSDPKGPTEVEFDFLQPEQFMGLEENTTMETAERSTVSELNDIPQTSTNFVSDFEDQALDLLARTSTEIPQNTIFDDVDRTTGTPFGNVTSEEVGYWNTTDRQPRDRERRCKCFKVSHPCLAPTSIPSITTEEEKQELVNEIKKELTIDADQTSSAIRKRTSAEDKRQSSVSIGLIGVAMISIILSLIILPDAITLIAFFISCLF